MLRVLESKKMMRMKWGGADVVCNRLFHELDYKLVEVGGLQSMSNNYHGAILRRLWRITRNR